jgi:hypothetical protein
MDYSRKRIYFYVQLSILTSVLRHAIMIIIRLIRISKIVSKK